MAQYALIDGYLNTMRSEIRWCSNLDDLVGEMEDHLYSTVEGMLATGAEPDAAQRATLDRFGEPKFLAALYASTHSGGMAVPTTTTIRAGTLALTSAAFWLIAATLSAVSEINGETDSDWHLLYLLLAVAVGIAGVLSLFVMVALGRRHGGFGTPGLIALILVSAGVVISIVLTWAAPMWMGILGIGFLTFGMLMYGRGLAPKLGAVLLSVGMLVGTGVFFMAVALEIGWTDSYGDYPMAWILSSVVGFVLTALGFVSIGLWLRSETPVEDHREAIVA